MGGRGAKSGVGGGGGSGASGAAGVVVGGGSSGASGAAAAGGGGVGAYSGNSRNIDGLEAVWEPGYDANGNPQVLKYQGQEDDKTARFLAKVANTQDYPDDEYGFYQGNFQQFSLAMGLNDKPTVLSDAEFDRVVKENNLQVLYRGESGARACDRFLYADLSHTGVGTYGDGFYFSEQAWIANDYARDKGGSGGRVLKMALSPNAKAIRYSDLMTEWNKCSPALQAALTKQGRSARNATYNNEGQAQLALKLGYTVVSMGGGYHYGVTRDAFIVSEKYKHHY